MKAEIVKLDQETAPERDNAVKALVALFSAAADRALPVNEPNRPRAVHIHGVALAMDALMGVMAHFDDADGMDFEARLEMLARAVAGVISEAYCCSGHAVMEVSKVASLAARLAIATAEAEGEQRESNLATCAPKGSA